MTPTDPNDFTTQPAPLITRRRALITLAGGAGALVAIPAAIALGHDDDDHDDDEDDRDNSGPGNAEDRHDDHDDPDDDNDTDTETDTDDDDEGDVAPAGTVPAGSVEVRIVDDDANGFQPATITVDAGQSITFVNLDDEAHTATGADFDTGIMQPGQLVTITIDEPGSFGYSCQIHPVMTGRIEVRDADGNVPGSPAATPEGETPVAATPAATGDAAVRIENFAFHPQEIEVPAGTTITWTNQDQVAHTATNSDGVFDTGTIMAGASASHTFDTAGRFEYVCIFHVDMAGVVVVV